MYIIVKGKSSSKDNLHHRRKYLESGLKETIFSKDKMDQRDCHDEDHENKRVADYDKWKQSKMTDGTTHEKAMAEWHGINKKFKDMGEEGKMRNTDELRSKKTIKYN